MNISNVALVFSILLPTMVGCKKFQPTSENQSAAGLTTFFTNEDTLHFTLKLNFSTIMTATEEAPLLGEIATKNGNSIPIEAAVKGKTSKTACEFPKMKISIPKESRAKASGDDFSDINSFDIGTHCDLREFSSSGLGRLGNELSPFRERFIYKIYDILSPYAHKTRRAVIKYVDSGTGTTIEKMAFLLERPKAMRERLGSKEELVGTQITAAMINWGELIRIHLFQRLVGGTDFKLFGTGSEYVEGDRISEHGMPAMEWLWNNTAFRLPNGEAHVVPNDFDIAEMINPGIVGKGYANLDFMGDVDVGLRGMVVRVQALRQSFKPADLAKEISFFVSKRPEIEKALLNAELDPEGKKIASNRIRWFYQAIGELLDLRAIGPSSTKVFADASLSKTACTNIAPFEPVVIYEDSPFFVRFRFVRERPTQFDVRCTGVSNFSGDFFAAPSSFSGSVRLTPKASSDAVVEKEERAPIFTTQPTIIKRTGALLEQCQVPGGTGFIAAGSRGAITKIGSPGAPVTLKISSAIEAPAACASWLTIGTEVQITPSDWQISG